MESLAVLEVGEIGSSSISSSFQHHDASSFQTTTSSTTSDGRTSLFDRDNSYGTNKTNGKAISVVDVKELGAAERHLFIDNLLKKIEDDNRSLLWNVSERMNRVGLELPTVEVRCKNLCVEAKYLAHEESPPTLWSTLKSILSVSGDVSYNGYKLNEFIPQKTSAYVSQHDVHISEMTVRETLDFSACCQGIGRGSEIMMEIISREKKAGIIPEPDIDTYMKASSIKGLHKTLRTDYILKILGLDTCADIIVGDAMRTGISGGQKRRLTTEEMMIGPSKVLLMDEISTGLDSLTSFQIITCLRQWTQITGSTTLLSILQPAPEIFDLFDDIILMAEGKIASQGPRDNVIEFFEHCGFKCPPRKGIADFLQEVCSFQKGSRKVLVSYKPNLQLHLCEDFGNTFKKFHVGQQLDEDLCQDFSTSDFYKNALSFNVYSLRKWELFKASMAGEWLLLRRNSSVHILRFVQLVVIALITMTTFLHPRMNIDVVQENYCMGSLFYALMRLVSNGIPELFMTSSRLDVFYKQRDMFFCQLLILFLLLEVSISWFRLVASVFRNPYVAVSCAFFSIVLMFYFGGFIISQTSLPTWLKWGFWVSPFAYAEIGASVNEFLAPRWQKVSPSNATIWTAILVEHGLNYSDFFYWISVDALIGFWLVFNIGFTLALTYSKPPRKSPTIIFHKSSEEQHHVASSNAPAKVKETGVVLSFKPMTITFQNVRYFIKTPKKIGGQGFESDRVQLLKDITGTFRPGVLTALMGVSGAGKTTLMDVLSGRKTSGIIEGDIRIGGYPKLQDTYTGISGYCEQTHIHSPHITILESLTYSAWLCLPQEIDQNTKSDFVQELLQMLELDGIKDALVGFPGVSGISNEQRKRLTIALKLLSNPSILFMDEPTTGLDARAAAIIIRVVKNVVNTRRIVVCTIHQPSIDIFEAFDEIMLMKRGGQIIYSGELGKHSNKLIEYFEGISGVPKIRANYNPATWMLEVTSPSSEAELGLDFAGLFEEFTLYRNGEQDLFNITGAIFVAILNMGIGNCSTVIPFIATERSIVYKERFSGMYSPWAYSLAQVTIEIPYVFLQVVLFVIITYPAIGFYSSIDKVLWYMYIMFCTMLYFTYFGMLVFALTPKVQTASILASFSYTLMSLFAGFLIPGPNVPKWWVWFYRICPTAWSLQGLLTSQYGDIEKEIIVFGEQKAINAFLRSYYGYHHHLLGVVALVLFAFPLAFAAGFAYATAKLNFQRR
ncbi:hypothetical protein Vadar_002572 [Vaccinium darrowii]|uniref:Uncharacterized protein n=1 Tax=Vaccinium darrowii TaxID=229202 RepID=A0ACB7YCB5_9ERIC|nr:hypothetical protein Vadar_002572 [Vaccinium darrowii]